jgi:hypothetical protein
MARSRIAVMTDTDSILDRVSELIATGQHRDEVPGKPGVALTGGGAFVGNRRLCYRGTKEFGTAAAEGLSDRLPPPLRLRARRLSKRPNPSPAR